MKGCRSLKDQEVAAVTRSFTGPYAARERAIFALGVYTGERISAILSLRVGDVVQAGRIADSITYRRNTRKGKTEGRTVKLHPKAKAALKAWIAALSKFPKGTYLTADDFVFQGRKGTGPISRVQYHRALAAAVTVNALPGRIASHSARKTFADRMYVALGKDLFRTQKALGHANVGSTIQYLSFRESDIESAILSM